MLPCVRGHWQTSAWTTAAWTVAACRTASSTLALSTSHARANASSNVRIPHTLRTQWHAATSRALLCTHSCSVSHALFCLLVCTACSQRHRRHRDCRRGGTDAMYRRCHTGRVMERCVIMHANACAVLCVCDTVCVCVCVCVCC